MVSNSAVQRAPPVTTSVFDEALPMLYASQVAYQFADVVMLLREEYAKTGKVEFDVPDSFPLDLKQFVDKNLDLTDANNGSGVSFAQLYELLVANQDFIAANFPNEEFLGGAIEKIKDYLSTGEAPGEDVFLSTFRSLEGKVKCVYGVIKDSRHKRIIVFFRGSENPGTNRDWETNLNARLTPMKTPKQIRELMPEGPLQTRVLVHEGFYSYLFDNTKAQGQQRYDDIIDDIKPLLEKEEGYSVYITGHSLGGALATMFSFKIAGAGAKLDWLPRPVTCISYAAPFSGTAGYRAAFERLEMDEWIRSLRVTVGEDIVPALPPFSLRLGRIRQGRRTMKHTGINLRLTSSGMHIAHSSRGGLMNAIRNSIFKPIWSFLKWHRLSLHEERMINNKEGLSATTLNELYANSDVVSERFLRDEIDYNEVAGEDEDEIVGMVSEEL